MHNFTDIFSNKILGVTLMVWAIAQTAKVFFGVIDEKRFNFKWFIGTGGMPSSHTAGVSAMTTCVGLEYGFDSAVFAIAAVFMIVTMFDAQGVRRCTGQQAGILNKVLDDIYWKGRLEAKKLKEFVGHSPFQVLVGFIFGVTLAILFYR